MILRRYTKPLSFPLKNWQFKARCIYQNGMEWNICTISELKVQFLCELIYISIIPNWFGILLRFQASNTHVCREKKTQKDNSLGESHVGS